MIWKELLPMLLNTSSETNSNISFIVPLFIRTDTIPFYKTVWFQCKTEIWLIGKFIKISMCREGKYGTKFSWSFWGGCFLVWVVGDYFFLIYGLLHVEVVLVSLCLQELSSYQRTRCLSYRERRGFFSPHFVLAYAYYIFIKCRICET